MPNAETTKPPPKQQAAVNMVRRGPGEVSRLLNVAAELAILDGREMIDLSHIEQARSVGL
jgi:hypothetical protein